MNIDELIPPVLQPYKAWIVLALFLNVYIIRPSLPAPTDKSPWIYVFLFNVSDKLSGSWGNAAHVPDNIPAQNLPDHPVVLTSDGPKPAVSPVVPLTKVPPVEQKP